MKDHTMTTRSKSACELYRIWAKGQYAAISLVAWENPDRTTFGGELLVHTSIGDFGNMWPRCPVPFRQFLLGLDLEAFMTACCSQAHLAFDGAAAVNKVRQAILAHRRSRRITAETACALWGEIEFSAESAARSELHFRTAVASICTADTILGPADGYLKTPSPQVRFFWDEMWPEFKAMLNELLDGHPALAA